MVVPVLWGFFALAGNSGCNCKIEKDGRSTGI